MLNLLYYLTIFFNLLFQVLHRIYYYIYFPNISKYYPNEFLIYNYISVLKIMININLYYYIYNLYIKLIKFPIKFVKDLNLILKIIIIKYE